MRTAVTIARKHDAREWELVLGPDTPVAEHRSRLKAARVETASAFAEIQLWESGAGCLVRATFKPVAETGDDFVVPGASRRKRSR